MSDATRQPPKAGYEQATDAEIEREIRSRRKFSLAEAIGRGAGDLLKGASPVTRKQQAEFKIEELIEDNLKDTEGALATTLLRRVKASQALLESYDEPVTALTRVIEGILASDDRLARFVTKVDAEWGRLYLERPHFDRDQGPPDADDPYTRASVAKTLKALVATLRATARGT